MTRAVTAPDVPERVPGVPWTIFFQPYIERFMVLEVAPKPKLTVITRTVEVCETVLFVGV